MDHLNISVILDKKSQLKKAPIISTNGIISDNDNEEDFIIILKKTLILATSIHLKT